MAQSVEPASSDPVDPTASTVDESESHLSVDPADEIERKVSAADLSLDLHAGKMMMKKSDDSASVVELRTEKPKQEGRKRPAIYKENRLENMDGREAKKVDFEGQIQSMFKRGGPLCSNMLAKGLQEISPLVNIEN
ncbi:hypothetical protein FEM48_Zijuj05G0045700 [Ziziphus jujuba var. spinosa]|uniref:Uncharacterized protein n=1 Tax=Ziziphus jujuba var. spinosa TaxID=714518 RepID=A0A978VCU7_ZIZJJ|nr:hypothetical protein FEM48_Zijuj05G0045700 [Ziziphus jujuba var. spinosa]